MAGLGVAEKERRKSIDNMRDGFPLFMQFLFVLKMDSDQTQISQVW